MDWKGSWRPGRLKNSTTGTNRRRSYDPIMGGMSGSGSRKKNKRTPPTRLSNISNKSGRSPISPPHSPFSVDNSGSPMLS